MRFPQLIFVLVALLQHSAIRYYLFQTDFGFALAGFYLQGPSFNNFMGNLVVVGELMDPLQPVEFVQGKLFVLDRSRLGPRD